MLNFNHLYYFHVTATEGTVAKAAERLGVGQPTISEQIRQLERSLGLALFERAGGKLKLTDAGRSAFEHTAVMFRAGERLIESLTGKKTPPPLSLRVGISSAVARAVATDFLMPVFELDDCIPTVRSAEGHDLLRDLRAHELDLVLSESDPGETHREGLQVVPVHQSVLVAVTTSPTAPSPTWDDLALVTYRPGSVLRFPVDAYLEKHGLHPRIAAETDDALVMMAAVTRGALTAFVPWSVAREHVASKRVTVLARVEPAHVIYALYHDAGSASVAHRAVELLVQQAREHAHS